MVEPVGGVYVAQPLGVIYGGEHDITQLPEAEIQHGQLSDGRIGWQ